MKIIIKKINLVLTLAFTTMFIFVGCREANRVSHNVSQEADNFNVIRRLTVI